MNILKQSTAVDVLIGPFVDSTDGYTAETGVSPSVKLSKNGQTLAAKNDVTTPTHDADGYYNCELDATDTNTIGTLVLTVAGDATSLGIRHEFQVIDGDVYDLIYGSGAAEPTGAPAATANLAAKVGYPYMALRNKVTVTSTTKTFFDDSDTAEWTKTLTDDGTTYTEAEGS